MDKYTERTIARVISNIGPPKKTGCWIDGKIHAGFADQSKSRCGVKYNRLIRLHYRIHERV